MGTRSITRIHDEQGNRLLAIYQQYDGYPEGVGKNLADFLKEFEVVDGIPAGAATEQRRLAHGADCLAAQLVSHLKGDQVGGVYIAPLNSSELYNYDIYVKKVGEPIRMVCTYFDDKVVFDGPVGDFDEFLRRNAAREK